MIDSHRNAETEEAVPETESGVIRRKGIEMSAGRPKAYSLTHTHSCCSPLELGTGSSDLYRSEMERLSKEGYFLGMISGIFSISSKLVVYLAN